MNTVDIGAVITIYFIHGDSTVKLLLFLISEMPQTIPCEDSATLP